MAQNKLNVDLIYPIGSIYMSVNGTNPSTLFGGTWEQLKDRFLLGSGDTYTNGDTGGSSVQTHTLDDNGYAKVILKSNGYIKYRERSTDEWASNYQLQTGGASGAVDYGQHYGAVLGGKTANADNMPPYLVVYMWKRIS